MAPNNDTLRKSLQSALDAQKSQVERNRLGQFATPDNLAEDLIRHIRPLTDGKVTTMLEPAMGLGALYAAFLKTFGEKAGECVGYELDQAYFDTARKLWNGHDIEIRQGDFLTAQPDTKFDMIVANPPYVRHHHIPATQKARLKSEVMKATGINLSGLAGLYYYFLMLSTRWLKEDGLSCWLIPAEFLDVNYGTAVKHYLTEQVQLLEIHRFREDDLQFSDALVSSCIVIFRNSKPKAGKVAFTQGKDLNAPSSINLVDCGRLKCDEKWSRLFESEQPTASNAPSLGEFFTVKRGIATGKNDFFIVDLQTIKRYNLPPLFLVPILPSPRLLKTDTINGDGDGMPLLDEGLFLFSCDMGEERLKKTWPDVWKYIAHGISQKANEGYICSKRNPWYACERRKPAPIVIPYMGREQTKGRSFRFIRNESMALTTNVYLSLYPRADLEGILQDKMLLEKICETLNAIPIKRVMDCGRTYGGGLHKLEPKELMSMPVPEIRDVLTNHTAQRQSLLF